MRAWVDDARAYHRRDEQIDAAGWEDDLKRWMEPDDREPCMNSDNHNYYAIVGAMRVRSSVDVLRDTYARVAADTERWRRDSENYWFDLDDNGHLVIVPKVGTP